MSNQQTAAEWKQAAANARAELQSVSAKIDAAEADVSKLEARQREIMQQRNALSREGVGMNDPRAAALRAEYFSVSEQVQQQKSHVGELVSQETRLEITVNNANTQAAQAESGAPNTSTNTPPATDRPNTDPATVAPANAVPPPDISTPASTTATADAEVADLALSHQLLQAVKQAAVEVFVVTFVQ